MNKVAGYLQEHLDGEVLTSLSARKYFSTDASILQMAPTMVVYPAGTNDVRKITRFTWQLAEKGHKLPITARGRGTDLSGAAIGSGIVMVFPAYMNRILELDTKQRLARVQPGAVFRTFQDAVQTHGLFLPPYPASLDYATIGGAIGNNSAGEKSLKYGAMSKWVDKLEVVLANGEVIQTGRVSKRELNRRKGAGTLEGEIYRLLDGLIEDNHEVIYDHADKLRVTKNSSGYNLADVKHKDGSFDLTPLFVGSQGTLGITTEAIVRLAPDTPKKELMAAEFNELAAAHAAIAELLRLEPSAIEMVDEHLLKFVDAVQPHRLKNLIGDGDVPAVVLLVEFDDTHDRTRRKKAKKALKILARAQRVMRADSFEEQQRLWSIRRSAAAVVNFTQDRRAAVPIIEDGVVPQESFQEYVEGIYELLKKHHLEVALWGHAGDANLHVQPLLDLSRLGDRQKALKLMDEYYNLVLGLGGSISAEHNDGRLRAPFAPRQHGEAMTEIFKQVKEIFDPHGTLNPGVKTGTDIKGLVSLLRQEYSLAHLSDHLPRM